MVYYNVSGFKENQSTPRPSEHPLVTSPGYGGENVKTFRWDQRLQIQNLFMVSVLFLLFFLVSLYGD